LAEANLYRFSSKEWHRSSALVYYGYRFYDPSLQRWPNRDPLGDRAFLYHRFSPGIAMSLGGDISEIAGNLYSLVANDPVSEIDPEGLLLGWLICIYRLLQWEHYCHNNAPNCPQWCTNPDHGDDGDGCLEARNKWIKDCLAKSKKMFQACIKAGITPPKPRR
jgi:RHS repeat-associated protein